MATDRWPLPALSSAFWGFRGIGWDVTRGAAYKSIEHETTTGRASVISNTSRSRDIVRLTWWARDDMNVVSNASRSFPDNEARLLMSFFRASRGKFRPFFWMDPTDRRVTNQVISASAPTVGADLTNPDSRNYQIVRALGSGGVVEPVGGVNLGVDGEIAGVITSSHDGVMAFTGNNPKDGWVRLTSTPTTGSLLTYTGSYYLRVAFVEDELDFHTFAYNFWEIKQINMKIRWW